MINKLSEILDVSKKISVGFFIAKSPKMKRPDRSAVHTLNSIIRSREEWVKNLILTKFTVISYNFKLTTMSIEHRKFSKFFSQLL